MKRRAEGYYWIRRHGEQEPEIARWSSASTWGRPAWQFVWSEQDQSSDDGIEVLSERLRLERVPA